MLLNVATNATPTQPRPSVVALTLPPRPSDCFNPKGKKEEKKNHRYLVVFTQPIVTLIRNHHAGLLGVNGRVRKVRRVAERALCDCLEERRLSHVGESDLYTVAAASLVSASSSRNQKKFPPPPALRRCPISPPWSSKKTAIGQGRTVQWMGQGAQEGTHNSALQVVAGPSQRDLLLLDGLLGRHSAGLLVLADVGADENEGDRRRLWQRRGKDGAREVVGDGRTEEGGRQGA